MKFYTLLKSIGNEGKILDLTLAEFYNELANKVSETVYQLRGSGKIKLSQKDSDVKLRIPLEVIEYINVNLFASIKDLKIQRNEKKSIAHQLFNLNKKHRDLDFIKLESKLIKYLKRNFIRLARYAYAGNTKGFTRLCQAMLSKSHALRVRSVYKVIPGFHTKYKAKYILDCMRISSALMKLDSLKYNYKRVWIPKPKGPGLRPLSVAPIHWRMVANTIQVFAVIACFPNFPDRRFHGGLPSRGPNTWWKTALSNRLFKSNYIYEFDLSKYFDTLDESFIRKALTNHNIPEFLVGKMMSMVKDHRDNLEPKEKSQELNALSMSRVPKQFVIMQDLAQMAMQFTQMGTFDAMRLTPNFSIKYEAGNGIPQGLSISPLISVLVASEALTNLVHPRTPNTLDNVMMYIDDGIIFTDYPIHLGQEPKFAAGVDEFTGKRTYYDPYGETDPGWTFDHERTWNPLTLTNRMNPVEIMKNLFKDTGSVVNDGKSHLVKSMEPRAPIIMMMVIPSIMWLLVSDHYYLSCFIPFGVWLLVCEQSNITHKPKFHKSSVVFCGVEYNLLTDRVRGKTHNGSELEFAAHDVKKLEQLVYEGYYPSDYIRMTGPELSIALDVFDPILSQMYNNNAEYKDELRRARSSLYSLPSEVLISMLHEVEPAKMWGKGWKADSIHALMADELSLSTDVELNEFNATSYSLQWLSLNKRYVYDKRRAANITFNKVLNVIRSKAPYETKKTYIRYLVSKH